jgi:hypothetical protein
MFLLSLLLITAQATPTTVQEQAPTEQQSQTPPQATAPAATPPATDKKPAKPKKLAKDDPERVVCRTEPVTGSLVRGKRICKTQAEWKQLSEESKDYGNRQQQRAGEVRNPG